MPTFQIHDDHTGLKLLVEGPEAPTDREAAELVQEELSFLSTNLYHGASNKFMLDVGPLSNARREVDQGLKTVGEFHDDMNVVNAKLAAADRAGIRVKEMLAKGDAAKMDAHQLFETAYQEELKNAPRLTRDITPTPTEQTEMSLQPNTLLIVAHGAPTGGFSSEGGQPFTLHNIAQVLGPRSNEVRNVINTACYGGKCSPADFQAAFPNVTNVQSADPTQRNIISINALAGGRYFATNTVPGMWQRVGTNWEQAPLATPPLAPAPVPAPELEEP